ncbi:squalene/phytoene synthase family protein [Rhodobacteraceae bacterium DSL-40]|uniref:phytoene/squalene synthase family protein n=1 Tax=Amaricoccus sp. B4 TaxID=3368557 RepID=UPI000DACCC66
MSVEACAALVARTDADRWRAASLAAPEARAGLMALHAFNIEIARAPWVASEPLLAEIRLRWWTDAIEEIYAGAAPRRHEVVEPLAEVIRRADLPKALFLETIEARLFDAEVARFADVAAFERHVNRTAGHMTVLAARSLGAPDAALSVVREYACGAGTAAFLRALPEYAQRGHEPLPPGAEPAELARTALGRIAQARRARRKVPGGVLPALLPGALAAARLRQGLKSKAGFGIGGMELSEFERRARLAWVAFTGRW